MMPIRTGTRSQNRANYVNTERKHNRQSREAAKPPKLPKPSQPPRPPRTTPKSRRPIRTSLRRFSQRHSGG
jgi:hypothetical protein